MRVASFWLLAFLSLCGVAYAVVVYGFFPLGALAHPIMRASFQTHPPLVYGHVIVSAIALLLGWPQFSTRLRVARPAIHRWTGRLYLCAVSLGGLSGLYLSAFAFGGITVSLAFGALAVAWLYSGGRAYASVRARDFGSHRRWMVRNFSLTFAGLTLRLYIFAALASGFSFEAAYPKVAWLWLLNLAIAELLFNRTHNTSIERTAPGKPVAAAHVER